MTPVITLTTDFGTGDAYVASIKGVILTINPKAIIVDITHSVEPQNILQAAFIVSTAHHYFPGGTIHLVIVDPGVGSQRNAIILKTPLAYFLAPDNGVLSYMLDELETAPNESTSSDSSNLEQRKLGPSIEAIAITNSKFWRQQVSSTFHGRDIFASVAAYLSIGTPLHKFGEKLDCLYAFRIPQACYDAKGSLVGHILHIDNFGNLITNLRYSDLPLEEVIIDSQRDGLMAILGSNGYLEISLKNGNAASYLGSKVGDEIRLKVG
jgi:hypothetical protein